MALVSRKAPQSGKGKKQKIKVNPYEIEGNTLDLIAQIAAARPNDAISEYWNPINDFFFNDDSTKREVVERDDDNENEKKVMRSFTFKEYFYKFRGEFYDADFLRVVYNKVETLAREIQSVENTKHTQIVVAGGFSAGKSSFLNRLTGYGELLPTGVEPVSVVSTYLYCSNGIKDVKVQGLNAKNTVVDLDRNILEGIKHSNGSSHHFASVLEKLFVTVPSNSRIDGLAFIDTPGYDNSISVNASNGKTDRETAEASLSEGQFLIWLVDAEKGALRKEDIAMIGTFAGPQFIVFNKADKKGSECRAIVETAYSELSKALGEENNVVDVLAYSTSEDKLYYSMSGFSSIYEILQVIKDNAANGLSHRNEIIDEIKTMFDEEIDWSKSSIEYYTERYKEALEDKKKWVECLESWKDYETEINECAQGVIIESYDKMVAAIDKLIDVSKDSIINYRDLINDSWGYINGKLSSSESLERILNYYGGKFDGFVNTHDDAIKLLDKVYTPERRKMLFDKFIELHDLCVNRVKELTEDSKDRTNAQLDTKISCEKRMNDMTNFKKRFLDAVKLGIDSYEAKKRSVTNKVSLNDKDMTSVDVFTAIDKGDINLFTKCFVNEVDMTVFNSEGYSPLTYAVKSGNNAMVKFLINHEADYSALDGRGYNAFHTAVENQYKDICEILLNIDSDLVDSKTKSGESASDLLEKNTFKNWLNSKI